MEQAVKNSFVVTQHAYDRAKERFKWKPKVLDRMVVKVFEEGIHHKDTKGTLMRHITNLRKKYPFCNNVRIYGEDIYFFSGHTLITLYRLDQGLLKHLKYIKDDVLNEA